MGGQATKTINTTGCFYNLLIPLIKHNGLMHRYNVDSLCSSGILMPNQAAVTY